MITSISGYSKKLYLIAFLLPKWLINLADKGIVLTCPKGISNKSVPSSASEIPKLVLITGIRLAQEESISPWEKKNSEIAIRVLFCCWKACFWSFIVKVATACIDLLANVDDDGKENIFGFKVFMFNFRYSRHFNSAVLYFYKKK